jgi:hypothetical protein
VTDTDLIKLVQRYGELCTEAPIAMECGSPAEADKIAVEAAEVFAQIRERIAALEQLRVTVRDMHHARGSQRNSGCTGCGLIWPCPTYLAVKDAGEVSADPT